MQAAAGNKPVTSRSKLQMFYRHAQVDELLRGAQLDGVVKVSSADALAMTRRLSREFGLLVGTSSGANITAALRTACDLPPTAKVVTILCDRAERYYSTKLFAEPPAP
jgi:cysteine synthase A